MEETGREWTRMEEDREAWRRMKGGMEEGYDAL